MIQTIEDFLTFKTFISPSILMLMYIFGALMIPMVAWWISFKLRQYLPFKVENIKVNLFSKMRLRDKAILVSIMLFMLLCMQIAWRMMFEFLIAYMQIRDVLVSV